MSLPSTSSILDSIRLVLSSNCNEDNPDDGMMWVNVAENAKAAYLALKSSSYPFDDLIPSDVRISPLKLVLARAIILQYFEDIGNDVNIDRFARTLDLPSFSSIQQDVLTAYSSCGEMARIVLGDLLLHYGFVRYELMPSSPSLRMTLRILGIRVFGPFAARYLSSSPGVLASEILTASDLFGFSLAISQCRRRFQTKFPELCMAELLCRDMLVDKRSFIARDLLADCDSTFILPMLSNSFITGDDFCQLGALLAEVGCRSVDELVRFAEAGVRPFLILLNAINHILGLVPEYVSGSWVPGAGHLVPSEDFDLLVREARSLVRRYRSSLDAPHAEMARHLLAL